MAQARRAHADDDAAPDLGLQALAASTRMDRQSSWYSGPLPSCWITWVFASSVRTIRQRLQPSTIAKAGLPVVVDDLGLALIAPLRSTTSIPQAAPSRVGRKGSGCFTVADMQTNKTD